MPGYQAMLYTVSPSWIRNAAGMESAGRSPLPLASAGDDDDDVDGDGSGADGGSESAAVLAVAGTSRESWGRSYTRSLREDAPCIKHMD